MSTTVIHPDSNQHGLSFHWKLTWAFALQGSLQILQLDASSFENLNFENVFSDLKSLKVFATSMGYMPDNDVNGNFGNHSILRLAPQAYEESSFSMLEKELQLPGLLYPPDPEAERKFLEDAKEKIIGVVKSHLSNNEKLYRLKDADDHYRADSCLWDYFYHWIGIDEENKKIHFIAMGSN